MSNLREKYKATPIATLKGVQNQEDTILDSGKSDYLKKVNGINKHRICPAHPSSKSFFHIVMSHWLEFEKEGEVKKIKVNNAKVHGNQKRDVIDAYIDFVKASLDKNNPDEKAKIDAIYARDSSIVGKSSWVYYAFGMPTKDNPAVEGQFGLYEANRTIRDAINGLSGGEGEDEVVEFDPFTDVETGRCLIFNYNGKAKKSNQYYTGIKLADKATPLTDEQLEIFDAVRPLDDLFDDVYSIDDFEKALKGLKYFDEKNEIYLFDSEAFQEIVEDLKNALSNKPVTKEITTKATKNTKKAVAPVVVENDDEDEDNEAPAEDDDDEDNSDEFTSMTRDELKLYKQKNFPDLKFLKSHSDDDLRGLLRDAVLASKEVGNDEEDDAPAVTKQPAAPSTKKNEKLEKMKAELKGK